MIDHAYHDRQRLIHPGLRDIISGLLMHAPDPGMPWPDDDGYSIAIARCTGDAKLLDMSPPVCRCAAFEWPHARGVSSRCAMQSMRRLKAVVMAPELD